MLPVCNYNHMLHAFSSLLYIHPFLILFFALGCVILRRFLEGGVSYVKVEWTGANSVLKGCLGGRGAVVKSVA